MRLQGKVAACCGPRSGRSNRLALGVAGLLTLVLCASAWAQPSKSDPETAAAPVVQQLEAFRRGDFDTAFTFASGTIRTQFDRQNFETMVRRGYPEIAQSTFVAVTRTELVWEDDWKINGVATRPDAGII